MLDIDGFTDRLNEEISKQRIQSSTGNRYQRAIIRIDGWLMMHGINDPLPRGKAMRKCIMDVTGGSPSKVKQFTAAVLVYSRLMWGSSHAILSEGDTRYLNHHSRYELVEPKYTYEGQLKRIESIPDDDIVLALKMQLACGVRITELCKIRKSDIDFKNRMVHIARDKGGGEKNVFLMPDDELDEQLKSYLKDLKDDDYVFPYQEVIEEACRNAGIVSHDNRRHYIRKLFLERTDYNIAKGMKKNTAKKQACEWVSKIVGHSSPKITKLYLGKLYPRRRRAHEKVKAE